MWDAIFGFLGKLIGTTARVGATVMVAQPCSLL